MLFLSVSFEEVVYVIYLNCIKVEEEFVSFCFNLICFCSVA